MKRRTNPVQRGGVAPYRRYDKRPFRYSEAYYAWRRTITGKDVQEKTHKTRNRKDWRHERRAA